MDLISRVIQEETCHIEAGGCEWTKGWLKVQWV